MLSVSSRVKLPELPEARMETRRPMESSPERVGRSSNTHKTSKIMAELIVSVNAVSC